MRQPPQWEELGEEPSWYLDPLVARQKREMNQRLVRQWSLGLEVHSVLKTDLFEEAHGEDQILADLVPQARVALGFDVSFNTASRANRRIGGPGIRVFTSDVRQLALAGESIDLIISNSTLDHFDQAESFDRAIAELARVLRPGGILVVTVDNPYNPLYPVLRWGSRRGWTPFLLGYTCSARGLARSLEGAGLEVTDSGTLLHNPRMISTLLFLAIRRLLGRRGDPFIRLLLWAFALLEHLPTRGITACFLTARARKPAAAGRLVKDAVPEGRS